MFNWLWLLDNTGYVSEEATGAIYTIHNEDPC